MTKYDPALPVNQELILQEGMITDPAVIPSATQVDQMVDGTTLPASADFDDELPPGSFDSYGGITDISDDDGQHNTLSGNSYTMRGDSDYS